MTAAMTSRCSPPLFSQTRVDVVNAAMETKNPARCTMSVSATHTSGFNTGSDNQNKWLLFPLYSTCQHFPLKGGGGGDTRGSGSDVARPGRGEGGVGCAPAPAEPRGLQAARVNICFAGLGPRAEACRPAGLHRKGPWRWSAPFPGARSGRRAGRIVQPPGRQGARAQAPSPADAELGREARHRPGGRFGKTVVMRV